MRESWMGDQCGCERTGVVSQCTMTLPFETTSSTPFVTSTESLESSQLGRQTTKSSLVVAATGTGKTILMGGLAKSWPVGRIMMISHRYELNMQSIQSFERICCEHVDLEQSTYMADQRSNKARIVVASVQTLNSRRKGKLRMERFDPMEFGLLLIDEAHYSAAASYRRVVEHFQKNPELKLVGVTATPDRLDGVGLGCIYDKVACNYDIKWGIENGWLVSPRQVIVELEKLNLSEVHTVGGDLDTRELSKIVEREENLHGMAKPIVDFAGTDKQAIVFTASVAQAHRLAELIRDYHQRTHGVSATVASLDGSMSPQDPRRVSIVKDYKAGDIQYFVNCGIACEGFDAPNTKLIAIGRPTKSRARYTQMVGRGTRPLPGIVDGPEVAAERIEAIQASDKPSCMVLDFIGQSGRHSLVCLGSILAGDAPDDVIAAANRRSSNPNFTGSTLDAIREVQEERAAAAEARRKRVTVGVEYRVTEGRTLYDLSQIPSTRGPSHMYMKRATEKQQGLLVKLGYTQAQVEGMTMQKARDSIDYAIKHPKTNCGRWMAKKKLEEFKKQDG